jgi:putative photosynthetic complex assembly protein 2
MSQYVYPALHALFIWWFATGLVIYLDGLPRRTFRWTMLGSTVLLALSLLGLAVCADDRSVGGVYQAFTFGLLAWAWLEVSFYLGYVTGVRQHACPEGCGGWRHFGHAIQACLWHELAILAVAAAVVGITWGRGNQIGTWTFLVLWWMHESARLNVFLGVRNLNEEFIPDHLAFLKSFFRKAPMNLLFPVSVTVSTVVAVLLFRHAVAADADAGTAAGYTFVATLMTLAILEHWFLVLPLPAAALWRWSLASHRPPRSFDVEVVAGFHGAGKTSFLRRRLDRIDPAVRTLVLVADPEAMHLDAGVLRRQGSRTAAGAGKGGSVVLPLARSPALQIRQSVDRWTPQRIIIEPAGGADLGVLLGMLARPDLQPLVSSVQVTSVIDAGAFLRDFARLQRHFEQQATLAHTLVVNKTDLVAPAELRMVEATLRALNPHARMLSASYGAPLDHCGGADDGAGLHNIPAMADPATIDDVIESPSSRHVGPQPDAPGFGTWSTRLTGCCDPELLHELLEAVADGVFGQIERVKGVVPAGPGWVRFDCSGGRPQLTVFAAAADEMPRLVVVGREIDRGRLAAAFAACTTPPARMNGT